MKNFIKKFVAMAVTAVMAFSSSAPILGATAQDYVPNVDLNNGISLYTDNTTGSAHDHTASDNDMTIIAVDENYNALETYDTTVLKSGNMGQVTAPATKEYNNTTYKFSHYEYKTSVRNYVASYYNQFKFYVDPPMTILAVYTTGTPNPPTGPIVGMYKDPEVKDVNGTQTTFFYGTEAAVGVDFTNTKPAITFGRSALDSEQPGNAETFSTQASNIFSNNNYSYQFIVASQIATGGPINFDATVGGAKAQAQIKTWDFSTDAFLTVSSGTATTLNGLSIPNDNKGRTKKPITVGDESFDYGIKLGSNTPLSFNANMGDVIYIYGNGNAGSETILSLTNATPIGDCDGNLGKSGSAGVLCKYTADSTNTVSISGSKEMLIHCIKVNPYGAKSGGSVTPPTPGEETVTQTFTITPNNVSVTINEQTVSDNGTLTLTKGQTYTVTAPDGYNIVSVNGVAGSNTFTADGGTIAIVLEPISTEKQPIKVWPSNTGYTFSTVDISNTTGFFTTDPNYGGAYYEQYTGENTNPQLTTPDTENYYATIDNKQAYLVDKGTDITKLFMPMTSTVKGYTSGTVTISGKLTPSKGTRKWSVLTLMDEKDNEIAALRMDDSTGNYAIAIPAASDYTYSSTDVASVADTEISYVIRVDYTNKTAYLSVNGGQEVSIDITNTNGIAKLAAVTAHADLRNLYVGDINISHSENSKPAPVPTVINWYMQTYTGTVTGTTVDYQDGLVYYGGTSCDMKTVSSYEVNGTIIYKGIQPGGSASTKNGRYFTIDLEAGDEVTVYFAHNSSKSSTTAYIGATLADTGSALVSGSTDSNNTTSSISCTVPAKGTYYIWADANKPYFTAVSKKSTGDPTKGAASITVTNQNGVPIEDATVTAKGLTFENVGNGVYTANSADAGTYTVTASKNGVTNTAQIQIDEGGSVFETIVLTFTNGSITITVTDGANKITNATVTAEGLTFTNNGDGTYTATGVADGTYTITVSDDETTKTTTVTIFAGSKEEKTVSLLNDSLEKIEEYLNIILARSVKTPCWNTEKGKFDVNTWHYVNGAMVTAFLDMYEATGDTRYSKFATDTMNLNIESNGSFNTYSVIKNFIDTKAQLDGVREMTDFTRLYKLTGDSRYNIAADYIYTHTLSPIDRILASEDANATGSFSHKQTYPNQIWLDGFFMGFPFYMQYAVYKGNNQEYIDDVYTQFSNLRKVDRDSATGLYYHGYNGGTTDLNWAKKQNHSKSFWLRASAWLAMSYPDVMEFMPEGSQKEDMKTWFKEYMDAVLKYQDPATGMWRQVMDKGDVTYTDSNGNKFDNYFETSGSAGMAAALMKGYRLGYLDDIKYYNAGLKAFEGICNEKLYYSDKPTSDIYDISMANNTTEGIDWITPWLVTNANNKDSSHIGEYMILKDICRVGSLGATTSDTTTTNYGTKPPKDSSMEYYLQEFRVDNDGKAIAPLVRAYSEVLIHNQGGKKKELQ